MDNTLHQIWERKYLFFSTFFVVFTILYIFFTAIDFLPEPIVERSENIQTDSVDKIDESSDEPSIKSEETNIAENTSEQNHASTGDDLVILPVSITIKKLDKTVPVLNPTSRSVIDLDTALLSGAVRHPDSAVLNQNGNIFILGHSSYLPNVFNKNFQSFNGIQNLAWGDTIEVFSDDQIFEYQVEKVYRAKAQDLSVPIAGTEKILTLATCNSFGSVDDRYIVEAKHISTKEI